MNWYKIATGQIKKIANNAVSWLSPAGKFFPNLGKWHEVAAEGLREKFYGYGDGSDSYDFLMKQGWIRVGNSVQDHNPGVIVANNHIAKSINSKQKSALINLAIESKAKAVEFDNGGYNNLPLWRKPQEEMAPDENEYVTAKTSLGIQNVVGTISYASSTDRPVKMFIDNTGQNLRPYWDEIKKSIIETGKMPEELADLITVTFIDVNGEMRARLDMA